MIKQEIFNLKDEEFDISHKNIAATLLINGKLKYEYDLDAHNLETDFNVKVKVKELYLDGEKLSDGCVLNEIEKELSEKLYFENDCEDVSITNEDIIEDIVYGAVNKFKYYHLDRETIEDAIKYFSAVGIKAFEEGGKVRVVVQGLAD